MTPQLRLLFDDCLSKRAVSALGVLADFTDGRVEIAHLVDFALTGKKDDEWIPEVDKSWIVVTTDRGKKNHGGKLPLICQRCGITHVMLSGSVHSRNTFEKIRAIFGVWPDLVAASQKAAGYGYLLRVKTSGEGVQLDVVFEPPAASDPPKSKQLKLDNM